MNILRNCLMAASFLILAGKAVSADEASDLLFKVTFDQYQVRADRSGGKPDTISFDSPDLQLRMWKGVKDNKNAVTLSGNEVLDYEMKGNFDPRQGTVSLWVTTVRSELEEAFFYAEKSGGENDVFEKIALWLNSRDEKRRNLCLKLIEPFFILGTGIFLMIFLFNLAIPFFSELSVFF